VVHRARLSGENHSADEPPDRPTAELRALLAEARRGEGHQRPRWEAARRGLDTLMEEVHDDLTHLAVVQTSTDERVTLRTWVGWGGDTVTVLTAGASSADRSAQAVEVGAEARRRLHRLRLLVMVLAAAPRVAALFTTPGGAARALPACRGPLRVHRAGVP
jgi:hypothetical protein